MNGANKLLMQGIVVVAQGCTFHAYSAAPFTCCYMHECTRTLGVFGINSAGYGKSNMFIVLASYPAPYITLAGEGWKGFQRKYDGVSRGC